MSKIPFFRLFLCLSIGILIGHYCCGQLSIIVLLVIVLSLIPLTIYCKNRNDLTFSYCIGISLCLFIVLLGCAREWYSHHLLLLPNATTSFVVKVDDVPHEKPKSVGLSVEIVDLNAFGENVRVILYVKKDSSSLKIQEGDYLLISRQSFLKKKEEGYDLYLNKKGMVGSFYVSDKQWFKCGESKEFSLRRLSHDVQRWLVQIFRNNGIDGDELAVVSALTVGDKRLLDKDLRTSYSVAGASHILAVSGLHVGVVYMVFSYLLSHAIRSNRLNFIKILVSLSFLWLYVFVTGLSPSVIRAAIMLTLLSGAPLLRRKSYTYNTVFVAAFFMLLYSPFYLFDVGFQLSFTAVLSILMFQQPIYNSFVAKKKYQDKAWSLLSVSLAAQLGTMPLSLYYFNQFSNYFWLSGFIVIPLSSAIIYLSIALWSVHWIGILSTILSNVLQFLSWLMNEVVRYFENVSGAMVNGVDFSLFDVVVLYLLLFILWKFYHKQSYWHTVSLLSLLFAYSLMQMINFFCNLAT